jgi:subtilase family serine protease
VICGAVLCFGAVAFAAEDRIRGPVTSTNLVRLSGNVNPRVARAVDRGAAGSGMIRSMRLVLGPSAAASADLAEFLEKQRDPSSSDYRNWLSPEEYGERFGSTDNDLAAISSWLESAGFKIEQVARARNWITFTGTADQIAQTFHCEIHRVDIGDEERFSNTTDPWIPESLAGIVTAIRGLDDIHPRPSRATVTPIADFNGSNGTHYLAPDDYGVIYDIQSLYRAGFDGTGQKLAIAGQTDIDLADLRAFRSQFSLTARDPEQVLFGADPGANQDDQIEADLDLEWSGAVARNATIIYVYSQDVFESVQYAIDQDLAPVISTSYGGCELSAPGGLRSLAQQGNAEGITWMNSAGDSGAAGCDSGALVATEGPAATFPADIPEVTAVGGTEFSEASGNYWSPVNTSTLESVLSYIPEKAWNDTPLGFGLAAGGGGPSLVYAKPWWQSGPGVPNDEARDVPDLALAASGEHDGYAIYAHGELISVGGTSASSPSFAGVISILNQYLSAKGTIVKPGLGNINPVLYNLAQNGSGIFHDVTTGNNVVPCAGGSKGCVTGSFGYPAASGYDLATGLGSIDAYKLVAQWSSLPAVAGTSLTLAVTPQSVSVTGTAQLTATLTLANGGSAPGGSLTFTAGGTSLGSATLNVSRPAATATLTISGASLPVGANTVSAAYPGTAQYSGSSASATLIVTAPPAVIATSAAVTATPATIASSGSTAITVVVTPAVKSGNVPAGSVTFTIGNLALGSANLVASSSNAAATFTVKGSGLEVGPNAITASYSGSPSFGASATSVVVTVSPPPVSTSTSVTASPTTFSASGTTLLTAVVRPSAGSPVPVGTVTFSAGGKTLGTASLSASPATATLSLSGASLVIGANNVIATYAGSAGFAGSASTAVAITVQPVLISTSLVVVANPSVIAQSATTQLTATITAGSALSAGSVSFTLGNIVLGTAQVAASGSSGKAILTVQGSSLSPGADKVTASYSATGSFANSSSYVTVTVQSPPIATATTVSAGPAGKPSTILLVANVKAASGNAAPAGIVTFSLRNTVLGSVTLSGSTGIATGSLSINQSSLAAGNTTILATYASGSAGFSNSAASITINVAAQPALQIGTTMAFSGPVLTMPANGTGRLTVTVRSASGSAIPSGTVAFLLGDLLLGTASLTSTSGTAATATFVLKGATLAPGNNLVLASFQGSGVFSGSTTSMTVVAVPAGYSVH